MMQHDLAWECFLVLTIATRLCSEIILPETQFYDLDIETNQYES